jgi:hypothetical protein
MVAKLWFVSWMSAMLVVIGTIEERSLKKETLGATNARGVGRERRGNLRCLNCV